MNIEPLSNWKLGCSDSAGTTPMEWIEASVPGAVQLDWARAQGWPSHTWAREAERYQGLEDKFWHYRTTVPDLAAEGESFLILRDIDHHAVVVLDGVQVTKGGGVGMDLRIPLSPETTGSALDVIVFPAPKVTGQLGRSRATETTKAAVSYGWDFHPDLIPLGLAGGAWIESLAADRIESVEWSDRLESDLSRAVWKAVVRITGAGLLRSELLDAQGICVWSAAEQVENATVELRGEVARPDLWWPHGQGNPSLYTLRLRLDATTAGAGQSIERKVGFRRVRLVMAPGQWDEPSLFPKSRSLPPMTLEVNGRRIFAKGANIVGPDIFPATVTADRWRRLVGRAAAANMNTLRAWGGANAPGEAFFEACDEAGLMVVQEFPLGCNPYPDKAPYLAELEACARALIRRMAFHPCRILWSGGNELFNAWSGMTDQSHPLRLLASLTWQLDPDTPFVPTLPVEGVGHGYYLFRDPKSGAECFEIFQKATQTGYTEFGVPGASSAETIRRIIPSEELWPPAKGGSWNFHSGIEAWDVEPTSYLCLSTIEHYWGPQGGLEDAVARSQWLQAEGQRAIIEEARRQQPRCGWALLWCLNEPWPTAANQSLIAWPDEPKPALQAVTEAMRPVLASARVRKFQWEPGRIFEAEIFLLNDSPGAVEAGAVEVFLESGDWNQRILTWDLPATPAGTNLSGPTARWVLPPSLGEDLRLVLRTIPDSSWGSTYRLATRRPEESDAALHVGPRGLNV